MRRFSRPSSASQRILLPLTTSRQQQGFFATANYEILAETSVVRTPSHHFLACGGNGNHASGTAPSAHLYRIYGDYSSNKTATRSLINNMRFFSSATAPPSSSSSSQKSHHKSKKRNRRSNNNLQRKKTPKQLSYKKGNHPDRPKPQNKARRSGNRKQQNNNNPNDHSEKVVTTGRNRYKGRGRTYSDSKQGGTRGAKPSMASSVVDQWDENNQNSGIYSSPSRRRSTNTFQLDRLLDKQQEFCECLDDYSLFWYPDQKKEQHQQQKLHQSQSDGDSDYNISNIGDWRTVVDFCHPDPSENFPWLELSWEKVIASEDLFRRVCSSYHDLFVSCASYLTELSESHHNSHNYETSIGVAYARDYEENEADEAWTEVDLLRMECEDLLATILPSWERLRRERALLVEAYRPPEEAKGNDDEDDGDHDETETETNPRDVSYGEEQLPNPSLENHNTDGMNKNDADVATVSPDVDVSYQNNKWVGWLKGMITGDATQEEEASRGDHLPRITAHSDHECAPNHYHYTKLVGRLYFHYLPLERHNRSNPYHLYSKSEKEETSHGSYVDEEEDDSIHQTHRHHKIPYREALATWEQKRFEILGKRAEQMKYIVDQSLLPLTPNRNNNGTSVSKPQHRQHHEDDEEYEDSSHRVLTDKIVRLLIRSYLDMESLSAAQQAERVYHSHPNHRKRLLWYVTMCYLKVITNNNKALSRSAAAALNNNNNNSSRSGDSRTIEEEQEKELFLQRNQESSTAAKRICELVSSKHAKEAREFQHCSTIAFEALAILPQYARVGLKGYYDRVHSLGILKFGPKVWEALLKGDTNVSKQGESNSHSTRSSSSSRRRKRKSSRKSALDASSSSSDKKQSSPDTTTPAPVDLSQTLHSKDHRILNYLIQIYSHEENDLHRALRLLKVSLDLYSPHDLKESLDRSTFHKLLRKLSEQKRKACIEERKKKQQTSTRNDKSNSNYEFKTALGLLDSMVSDEAWFPTEETFRILFSMIPYCDNPGRDAETLRSKLEACRFLSGLAQNQQFLEAPYLLNPLEASALTLRAWLQTLQQHGGMLPPSEANPSQRALTILKAMKVVSSSLFPTLIGNNSNDESQVQTGNGITIHPAPTAALYSLALEVCSRDGGSPRATLDAAMDIFGLLQTDGLLLEGNACLALLGVLADFSNNNHHNALSDDLLRAKVEAIKQVCEALAKEDPCYGEQNPPIIEFLQKQSSYLRLRHPQLFEEYLAELGLLDSGIAEQETGDNTVIKGLGQDKSKA